MDQRRPKRSRTQQIAACTQGTGQTLPLSAAAETRGTRRARSPVVPGLSAEQRMSLKSFERRYGLRRDLGDLRLLEGAWYVTHAGLLRLAKIKCCRGIDSAPVRSLCDPRTQRWVFRAVVHPLASSKGFVGYADADPSNTPPELEGCEMRLAETRAVSRALRKAYGIGLCSIEELSAQPTPTGTRKPAQPSDAAANSAEHAPLRDRLRRMVRVYRLDPEAVRRYAAAFCGMSELREASRELIADFLARLEQRANHDHEGLLAHLAGLVTERNGNEVAEIKTA